MTEVDRNSFPDDWQNATLGDIALSFIGGGTPSTKHPEYWGGEIHWTTSKKLKGDLYLREGERKITQQGLEHSSTHLIPKKNLIIGTRVGVGKVAINLVDTAISQDLTGVAIDKNKFNIEFLAYQLLCGRVQSVFAKQLRGTTIKGIPRDDLKQIELYFPYLPEQQKIASVISAVQEAKEKSEDVLSALKELKKSMMKHLFTYGAVSIEEAEKVQLKETEIGMIPEHWEVRKLSDLFEFSKKPRSLHIRENDIVPFIPMELLSEEHRSIKGWQLKKMSEISSGTFVFKNDLIIAKITPSFENGKQAILNNLPHEFGYATTEVWALHPKDSLGVADFIYNYIRISGIRHSLASKMEGATGRQRLPRNVLENLTLPIPPFPEQQQIAQIFTAIDDRITAEQSKKNSLDTLFKTLLSLLMTGKIRVKDIEIPA